jgi:hypothetical protein
MSQELELDISFTGGYNPDVVGLRKRTLDWFRSCGFLQSDQAFERYQAQRLDDLGARWYPTAVGEHFDVSVTAVMFGTFLDDQIDSKIANQPDVVKLVIDDLLAIIQLDTAEKATPKSLLTKTFAKLWTRIINGMSPAWCKRHAESWRKYFLAHLEETENRHHHARFSLDQYLLTRRESGIDLLEVALQTEIPPEVLQHPQLAEMTDIVCDIIDVANDIQSLEKEELRGDIHNLIMVLQYDKGYTRGDALTTARKMIRDWSARFSILSDKIPALSQALNLSDQATLELKQYAAGLGTLMQGYYDWGKQTIRYKDTYYNTPDQPAWPEVYI